MRHPMAQLITFWAMLVVVTFAADVIYGGFSSSPAVSGFKQATTGA